MLLILVGLSACHGASESPSPPDPVSDAYAATPGIKCDLGSAPEAVQGYVPPEDFTNGRAERGYTCNVRVRSHIPGAGGFHVERYADGAGHVCAYYDTTRLLPADLPAQLQSHGPGVYVVDMTVPEQPEVTATLVTLAMLAPHESLSLHEGRGLLVAGQATPQSTGILDVYDVSQDCRHPRLLSSLPILLQVHTSAFAPDGMTLYVNTVSYLNTAVDMTNPALPKLIWIDPTWKLHDVSISEDGNILYAADVDTCFKLCGLSPSVDNAFSTPGLAIFDVSQIQSRVPNPKVTRISHLSWPIGPDSVPMDAYVFSQKGHRYVLETDEFGGGSKDSLISAARIINVDDPARPYVVSHLRLEIHNMPEFGFHMHECTVSARVDPTVVACGSMQSGLRVFDISNVSTPREVAYSNFVLPGDWVTQLSGAAPSQPGAVYSAPTFDPVNLDIWYADAFRGFYAVHLTPASGISRFATPKP